MLVKQLIVAAFLLAMPSPVVCFGHDDNSDMTIADILIEISDGVEDFDRNRRDYDILLKAVVTTNLTGPLSNPDATLTVFAPNDNAFYKLAKDLGYSDGYNETEIFDFLVGALDGLGDPVALLTDILLYHVAPETLTPLNILEKAYNEEEIETLLDGATIEPYLDWFQIRLGDKDPDLSDPSITFPLNLKATNGVIHTINRVLVPVDIP